MAIVIGTSGAWKSVCRKLALEDLHPEKITDIHVLLAAMNKAFPQVKHKAAEEVDQKIKELQKAVTDLESSFDEDVKKYQEGITTEIDLSQLELDQLQKLGFFRKLFKFFVIRDTKEKIRKLKTRHENAPKKFQKKISLAKLALEDMQNNREVLIEEKSESIERKIILLQNVISSPDFAGAIAELELIEILKKLPDTFYVISDVHLHLRKAVHFDGEWLKSAQIDHVVVSPSGIFVIEVKNWSKKYAEDGDYFDPFEQVKRANYLCYSQVGSRFGLKTRSMIAYKGALPPKPPGSYTKVLSLQEVPSYIQWFSEVSTSDEEVKNAANWLAFQGSLFFEN